MPHPVRSLRAVGVLIAAACLLMLAAPASGHGFTSTVYADLTSPSDDVVRAEIDLEYVLLVISAAQSEQDYELESAAKEGFAAEGADPALLAAHSDTVLAYLGDRFTVAHGGSACAPSLAGPFAIIDVDGVPYARATVDFTCPGDSAEGADSEDGHEIGSTLFPASEGVITHNVTIVQYDIGGRSGNATLDESNPVVETAAPWHVQAGGYFVLGAEHLLFGIDHILFLLALIVGSRRLRDVVLAATAFTIAHSVTFILAALGLVTVPAQIVEPIIAASIAIVALWHIWGVWRRRGSAPAATVPGITDPPTPTIRWGLTRADAVRVSVVFAFGLVHGLGFAGALGIDEPFSWGLLGSLLVFNLGIEVVQLGIIAVVFPLLLLLRRRLPRVGLWLGVTVAAFVAVMGAVWFFQRVLGVE